jgi:hypothetical protein
MSATTPTLGRCNAMDPHHDRDDRHDHADPGNEHGFVVRPERPDRIALQPFGGGVDRRAPDRDHGGSRCRRRSRPSDARSPGRRPPTGTRSRRRPPRRDPRVRSPGVLPPGSVPSTC